MPQPITVAEDTEREPGLLEPAVQRRDDARYAPRRAVASVSEPVAPSVAPAPEPAADDPYTRRFKVIQGVREQAKAQFAQEHPFAPSGTDVAVPQHMLTSALAQSDVDARNQMVAARQSQVAALKSANATDEAKYRAAGQQFYTDPHGRLQPLVENGRQLYHPTPFEEGVHPQTGEPTLQMRDRYGQRQYKTPAIMANPDPLSGKLYYQMPSGQKKIGSAEALLNHPDLKIAKQARIAFARQRVAQAHEAMNPINELHARVVSEFDDAKARASRLQDQADNIDSQLDSAPPGSEQALRLQAQRDVVANALDTVNTQVGKGGSLYRKAEMSKLAVAKAKLQFEHDAHGEVASQRESYLRNQGATDEQIANDSIYQNALAEQQKRANGMRQADTLLGRHQAVAKQAPVPAVPAPVQPDHDEEQPGAGSLPENPNAGAGAASPAAQEDLPDELNQTMGERMRANFNKSALGDVVNRIQQPLVGFGESKGQVTNIPSAGQQEEGNLSPLSNLVIPGASGVPKDVAAAAYNTLGKAAASLTSPGNLAILALTGGAGKVLGRLISGGFGIQMLNEARKQAPQAWKVLQDDKATRQQKIEAVGDVVSNLVMGGAAAGHALRGGGSAGGPTVPDESTPTPTPDLASRAREALTPEQRAEAERQLQAELAPPKPGLVQEPTTPAQQSALAIHQGLKANEALRQAPEGGALLKAQLTKEAAVPAPTELQAVADARAEGQPLPPPATPEAPAELGAVAGAREGVEAAQAGREIAGAGVSPEAQGRAEIAAREALPGTPVDIGPRDSTVSTGDGVPTEKETAMLAEQQRLVDEHLAQQKQPTEEPTNAIREQSPAGVLQRPSERTGETGGERGRVEQGQQGSEAARAQETPPAIQQEKGAGGEPPPRGAGEPGGGAQGAPGKETVREEVAPALLDAGEKKPPAQMIRAERIAELRAAGIKEVNGKPLTGENSANPAEIINAVGKLRRGKPDLTEPATPAEKRTSDKFIEALQKAKLSKPGDVTSHTPFSLAYDGAIDLAILGIRAGRTVAEAIKFAVDRFKARFPDHTPEHLAKLESAIREAAGEPEPTKPAATKAAPSQPSVSSVPKGESPVAKSKTLTTKLGNAWKSFKDESGLKQVIAATRDAVEGKANAYAAESKSEVNHALERAEQDAKARKTADDALRFFIESGDGNKEQLSAMRAKVEASDKASPKWKERALAAIDYAATNGEKLKDAATRYRRIMGEQLNAEQEAGLPTLESKNYVPRHQDVEDGSWLEPRSGSGATASGNRKNRSFETTADSIAGGINPKTLSAIDSMTARVKAGMAGVHQRSWQKSLYDMKDPATKEAVAVKPERVERADGSAYYQPPKGYDLESLGNTPTAIKKEYSGLVSALTDPSWFAKNKATLATQKVNANAKALTLAVDTFHLGRLAFRDAMINASHPQGFKVGARYQKGLLLADHSPEEITRMAEAGEIPKENLQKYLEQKKTLTKLVDSGYNIGSVADAMHQEFIQSVPGLGHVNKFIFQKFQRGAMTDAGILEFERQKADNPAMSDQQVAQKVSRELMTRFGNLGRQGLFKSRTAQDIMRMLFLAPQWNEGLIRSELGGVKDIAKAGLNAAQGKKAAMGLLGREMLTTGVSLFVASQILNQATRGKFTWQNPEEGFGAKLSAWIPDKLGGSSGFFLNPMGLTAETGHLLLNSYERAGNTFDPIIGYLRSRASAATRPLWTFLTGQNSLGQTLKPSERWSQSAADAIPAPISGGSVARVAKGLASGGKTEKFPGEFQKQAMQSFGLRTDKAPTPEQRIYGLAHEFNRAHGKEDHAAGEVRDYAELTAALRRGNDGDVQSAIGTLLEKRNAEDLEKYYRQWEHRLFTGSHKNETAFLRTLNPEQRQQYAQAHAERSRIGKLALRALSKIPTGKRAGPFAPATTP